MTMKSIRNWKTTLAFATLAGLSLAGEALAACGGTLYFKPPTDWSAAYIGNDNTAKVIPAASKNDNGWYVVDLATGRPTQWGSSDTFKLLGGMGACGTKVPVINATTFNVMGDFCNDYNISCPGMGGEIYVSEDPLAPGTTYIGPNPPSAKYLYVLLPEDKEWQSDVLMLSTDGGATGTQMKPAPNMCGWFMMVFENAPDEVLLYHKKDPESAFGMNGLFGDVLAPIPLAVLYEAYGSDQLYFIPDDNLWIEGTEAEQGWYTTDPGVDGVCEFKLAALIYDTDENLNPAFTSDPSTAGAGICTGVHHGLVLEDLGPDNKPVFSGSPDAIKCFLSESNFHALFNYVAGKNEVQCYDMPFRHYGNDSRWGYDSDSAITGGYVGGFYPVENTTDASVVTSISPTPCPACRLKRRAEGPVPYTIADFDHYCNTPGWNGGIDCGLKNSFNNGDNPAVWDWGAPRWEAQRNQQFCFESHAMFTYSEDQEFTFRGDDDIWVFINRKLAVDNGGAHLASPGHVVLKNLNATYGAGFLEEGKDYPIDIFFCDRRTTMSNVIIKTNMYIRQSTGIDYSVKDKSPNGDIIYDICWEETGDGSCAAVALGSVSSNGEKTRWCGKELSDVGKTINYRIKTRSGEIVAELEPGALRFGGIDLTDPFYPKINKNAITGLPPGSYKLEMEIEGKTQSISFRVSGNLDIVNKTSMYNPPEGDTLSSYYKRGATWVFVDKALVGELVPIYISAVTDDEVDLLSAVGQSYTLSVSEGMQIYTSKTGTETATFPRVIDNSGVDTLWVTVPIQGMSTNPEVKMASIGRANTAEITFHAPKIVFVRDIIQDEAGNITGYTPVTGDPDSLDGDIYYNWLGSDVDLTLLIVNPITNAVCAECDIKLEATEMSARLEVAMISNVNGVVTVRVRSQKVYYIDSTGTKNTASFTFASSDNPNLIWATYGNMMFREPPLPYPILVELFDTEGESVQTTLRIPTPYHSDGKEYLDGIADSIAITYHRPFDPDSLPDFICLEWDDDKNFELRNFHFSSRLDRGSTVRKDSLVVCSDTIGYSQITAAYATRPNDSTLTFGGFKFSKEVKTGGDGKARSWGTFEDRGQIAIQSFDRGTTDRIPPIILKARLSTNKTNKEFDDIRYVFSEPLGAVDSSKLKNALAYYMPSATEYDVSERYDAPDALQEITLGKDSVTVTYRHLQGERILKTPQVGDYARFAAGIVSDTAGNLAVDYKENVPSPWFTLTGDVRSIVRTIPFTELDPNDPKVKENMEQKKIISAQLFSPYDSLGHIRESMPNTVGHWIQTDMANLFEKYQADYPDEGLTIEDVALHYELSYFTNLGGFVAKESGDIKCTDESIFGAGENCTTNLGYIYLGWNGISNDGRLVGSGAYISKLSSYLKIGKHKDAKQEKTNMFGIRRASKKK